MTPQARAPWPVIGHEKAVAFFQRALANGRTHHAYYLLGPAGVGKRHLALVFAMALNCEKGESDRPCHECRSCQLIASERSPDLHFTQTSGSSDTISVVEVRRVSAFFSLQPYEMRHRIAILDHFERTAPNAQDALLKTLEEPPSYAMLFLLSEDESTILPTILSRCQQFRLRPLSTLALAETLISQYDAKADRARLIAQVSGGRPGWAIRALQDPELLAARDEAIDTLLTCLGQTRAERFALAERLARDKNTLDDLLQWWLSYWRDIFLLSLDIHRTPTHLDHQERLQKLATDLSSPVIQRAILATRKLSKRLALNLNWRLAIEVLLLAYPHMPRYHIAVA